MSQLLASLTSQDVVEYYRKHDDRVADLTILSCGYKYSVRTGGEMRVKLPKNPTAKKNEVPGNAKSGA